MTKVSICIFSFFIIFLSIAYWSSPHPSITFSPMLYDKNHQLISVNLNSQDKWRLQVDENNVSPEFLKMLVLLEDKRFYYHPGFDPIALTRAFWQWIKNGKVISGGSTLTMQTVRLLNPRARTLPNKIIEIVQAIGLEMKCSKKKILRLYLSLTPYGGNIEGLRTASLMYFSKEPYFLMPSQLALLAVIPQHPNRFNPITHYHVAKAARDKTLKKLARKGLISQKQLEESIADPIPLKRHRFPSHAPHAMTILKKRHSGQYLFTSTLDLKLQQRLETMLMQASQTMERHQTIAAIVVDNKSREIRAYIGSADPYNEEKQGHVDMLRAIRSPGSALKPFIYALGFENAMIHPHMIMDDVVSNFHGYKPTNFKDIFHGEVTVREALQKSLNIPVIYLLDRLGPGKFIDWLESVGIKLYFSSSQREGIGLPVALGGVGIRFTDLTSLYVALARSGDYQPITLEKSGSIQIPFLKSNACHFVTEILNGSPLPDGFADWIATGREPIAFKTGTSYGGRDAVCIGYSKDYTVGVWVGRADGTANPNQYGRKTAAPLVLNIFQAFLPFVRTIDSVLQNTSSAGILKNFKKHEIKERHSVLTITSPLSHSTHILKRHQNGTTRLIPIVVKGGTAPFTCWINGRPLLIPISDSGKALWRPPGIGFYNLTFVDSLGKKATCNIQLVEDG